MAQARLRAFRVGALAAVVCSAMLAGAGAPPAGADVTAVRGSAYGYFAHITLFGGTQPDTGPTPTVTLPAAGSSTPVTSNAPSALVKYGPATLFSAGAINVSTQGTTGPSGSVTSSSSAAGVNSSGQEVFTASNISSTCMASQSGASGSTTVTNGTLRTSEGNPNVDNDDTVVPVPQNPAPNTSFNGSIETVGDTFRAVFNEQVMGADGSITVNAYHLYLLGPTAVGDLIVGQSICGVTATAATTTTTAPGATTTTVAGATTTTAAGATTTTSVAATTTTASATTSTTAAATTTTAPSTTTTAATSTTLGTTTQVAGGAYGHFITVSLFGGPAGTRGPAPSVTLPAGGSATPITDSAPSATGQFGPATVFSSGALEVSTQGTPGGTVTSSAKVSNLNTSGQEVLTAASVSSTCSASASGSSGSATISGGKLTTSEGSNLDSDADDTVVQVPENPAPNTSYDGKIETVGDSFRYVFNEQVKNADGSITVNAAHQYLLGPTAVGELIIGQSRCGSTTVTVGGGGGGAVQVGATGGGGGGLAGTGAAIAVCVALAMVLVVGGSTTTYWIGGVRWQERISRRMPWARGLLR